MEALQVEVSALRRRLRKEQQSQAVKGAPPSSIIRLSRRLVQSANGVCVCVGTDGFSEPEQKNNLLLQDAIRALLGRSPLFCTQTLTAQAFPVPDQGVSMATQPNSVDCCRKRPRETQPERERKRRRSEC